MATVLSWSDYYWAYVELDKELDPKALLYSLLQCLQDPAITIEKDNLGGLGSCPDRLYNKLIYLLVIVVRGGPIKY